MTARICLESDSLSVLVAGAAEVLERCERQEPVIDRSRRSVPGAGVVAASFCVSTLTVMAAWRGCAGDLEG